MEKKRKRSPAQERWINEISDQDDQKYIKVLGSILDIKSSQDQVIAILDDGTGQIQLVIPQSNPLELGNQIRAFGILRVTAPKEYVIEGEIIQDMKDLDTELYKRVQEVKRRFKEKWGEIS
jgi:aspartyl/asparaginyl-tRNA synthetase